MTEMWHGIADSMKARRWPLALMLPIIVLLGCFLYEQARTWTAPLPRWIVPGSGGDYTGYCSNLVRTAREFEAILVDEVLAAKITRKQANAIADRIIARHYGFFPLETDPQLLRATFPDGQQRLAWYDVVLVGLPHWLEGEAVGIYIDALTGEPLMLVTDMYVGDPCMSCGCRVLEFRFSPVQYLCLVLLFIYLVGLSAVGLGFGLVRLVGRKQSPHEEADR